MEKKETDTNNELSKDELINQLMEDNKRLYKRSIFVVLFSVGIAFMGTHYGYEEAKRDAAKSYFEKTLKVYNYLQDKIDDNLKFPFHDLLSQFNNYEYYLMDNFDVFDSEEFSTDVEPAIDEYFDYFKLYANLTDSILDENNKSDNGEELDSLISAKVYKKENVLKN